MAHSILFRFLGGLSCLLLPGLGQAAEVTWLAPAGGSWLSGEVPVVFRVAQPGGVELEVLLQIDGQPVTGPDTVRIVPPADGTAAEFSVLLDTRALPDAAPGYRLGLALYEQRPLPLAVAEADGLCPVDNTPPTLTFPTEEPLMALEQTDLAGTPFRFQPQVADALDPEPGLLIEPLRQTYPLGPTRVVFTATDRAGNRTVRERTVLVQDTRPPTLLPGPNIWKEAVSPAGTLVQLNPSAWDACDARPTLTSDAPADGFPLGDTPVLFSAVDDAGNRQTATLTVSIRDTTPPRITLPNPGRMNVNQSEPLGTPTERVALPVPGLTDNGSPPEELSCRLFLRLRDQASQPVDPPADGYACQGPLPAGLFFPLGNTTLTYRVQDRSGNRSEAPFVVTVTGGCFSFYERIAYPPTDRWLIGPATVTLRINPLPWNGLLPRIRLTPLPAGLAETPQPGADGIVSLTYQESGRYDVRLFLEDGDWEQVHFWVPFGIDREPPTLTLGGLPGAGGNERGSVLFLDEPTELTLTATDPHAGLAELELRLQGNDPATPQTLLSRQWSADCLGSHGAADCRVMPETSQALPLPLAELEPGSWLLQVRALDRAGLLTELEQPVLVLDLLGALDEAPRLLARLPDRDGAAAPLVAAVEAHVAAARDALIRGELGDGLVVVGGLLDLLDHPTRPGTRPDLTVLADLLARGARSETRQALERQGPAADRVAAAARLAQADDFIRRERQPAAALLAVQNAYFLLREAGAPGPVTDAASAATRIDQLRLELREHATPPGSETTAALEQIADWLEQELHPALVALREGEALAPDRGLTLFLALQNSSLQLRRQETQGCWTRNWRWGLAQVAQVLVAAELVALDAPSDDCRVARLQVQLARAARWVTRGQEAELVELFEGADLRCTLLELAAAHGLALPLPLPASGCMARGC